MSLDTINVAPTALAAAEPFATDPFSTSVNVAQWRAAMGSQSYKVHQTQPTPSPGSGDRVFYESLYREDPANEMALLWCVEHGVFLPEEHDSVLKAYERAKAGRKKGSAAGVAGASPKPHGAPVPGVKKPSVSSKQRPEFHDSSAVPMDVGMSIGGLEMIGATTF